MDTRVLLIDFDPVAAELTGALLATRGIPFTLARNEAELDRALAAGPPALIVIDPARPDEGEGMRLCASLAERFRPAGGVPIILASRSLRGARWKTLARDAGAELFLERPKDDRLLLAAAERALGQARAGAAPPAPRLTAEAATSPRPAAPPAPTTTSVSHRTPPPPENELEDMVDQMFAQWFAEGGDGAEAPASGPLSIPIPARGAAPAAAPAAGHGASTSAALLEVPSPPALERSASGSRKPDPAHPVAASAAAAPTPVSAASAPAAPPPAPRVGPAPAAPTPRGAGSAAPTGPASVALRRAPASAPREAPAPPSEPSVAATPVGPAAEPAFAARGTNLVRPLAIAAAVALIGIGAGFVVLQRSGGPAEETSAAGTASTAVAAPVPATPAVQDPEAGTEPGIPSDAAAKPATPPAAAGSTAARTPESPPAPPPAPPRAEAKVQETAATRPVPAPPVASPQSTAGTPAPPPAADPVEAAAPAPAVARANPAPEPESEFIPDVAPDGTLPAAEVTRDATLARYVGPELIPSSRVTPAFPPAARQMRMSGQVKLQVKVRPDGGVGAIAVLSEPNPSVGFGKAATAAVRQWRYRPATLGSRAVESEIVVVVNFAGD